MRYSMEVIPKPKDGTAIIFESNIKGEFVYISGEGNDDYICGNCNNTICKNVSRSQIRNIVFKCTKCTSYNQLKGT